MTDTGPPAKRAKKDVVSEALLPLQQRDSVLEPDVQSRVRKAMEQGAKPEHAIKALSSAYVGYPQMCNIALKWLTVLQHPDDFSSKDADRDIDPAETALATLFDHTADLVLKTFNPTTADKIFTESADPPAWLQQMILDAKWRPILYKLAERHADCLLLNYAMQQISKAGFTSEIAAVSGASEFLDVFTGVMGDYLASLGEKTEDEIHLAVAEILKLAVTTEQALVLTMYIVHHAYAQTGSPLFQRVLQELSMIEPPSNSQIPLQTYLILAGLSKHPEIASALWGGISTRQLKPGDVMRLSEVYRKPDIKDRPPVILIQTPIFLQILVAAIYRPSSTVRDNLRDKYIYLLAYASTQGADDPDTEALMTVQGALKRLYEITSNNKFGFKEPSMLQEVVKLFEHPVVCMSTLEWIGQHVRDSDFYATSFTNQNIPLYLELVLEMARLHPLVSPSVLDFAVATYDGIGTHETDSLRGIQLKGEVINLLVNLVRLGVVVPVLKQVAAWATKADQSLTRSAVTKILEMAEPPYSTPFVNGVAKIIDLPGTINGIAMGDAKTRQLAQTFLDYCREHDVELENVKEYVLPATNR